MMISRTIRASSIRLSAAHQPHILVSVFSLAAQWIKQDKGHALFTSVCVSKSIYPFRNILITVVIKANVTVFSATVWDRNRPGADVCIHMFKQAHKHHVAAATRLASGSCLDLYMKWQRSFFHSTFVELSKQK